MENINIIRGDTKKLKFIRKDNNDETILIQPDNIYFSVKDNTKTKIIKIQKTLEDMEFNQETGEYTFTILPSDTNELSYATYKYDLEVKDGENYIQTIALGDFVVEEEVTFADNEV